jgi:uncharacterized protein YbcI
VPGFEFRYRLGGGQPTIRSFVFTNTETLARGDMLSYSNGRLVLAACGDTTLVGSVTDTIDGQAGRTYMHVVTDADAVYAVEDPHARREGDSLDLIGPSGAHGVATSPASEFSVVLDSTAEEETLIRIAAGRHHQVGEKDGMRLPTGGDLNAAVARAVVRFHREETGRGPNKAKAFYRDDVIVVVLEDLMTQVERRLVARGQEEVVRRLRAAFQETLRAELVPLVEEITGARVRAFMSSNHLEPDMAIEAFVLDQPIRGDVDPAEPST